jgi:ankyrin repeat protein
LGEGVGKKMQNSEGQWKLVEACFRSLDAARELIETDPACIRYQDIAGETAFHYVVVENRLDLAEFLLLAGSDINKADEFGATPLMHAVMLGYRELTKG